MFSLQHSVRGQVVPQAEDGVPAAEEPSGETREPVGILGSEFDSATFRTVEAE